VAGPKIKVIIADDHALMRAGLKMLLEAQPDLEVAGEAADGFEAVLKVREQRPDVLLLDIGMPGPRLAELVEHAGKSSPKTRVLVLTMHDDAYMRAAPAAGAAGYVVKRATEAELVSAIRAVHGGRTFVDVTPARNTRAPQSTRPRGGAKDVLSRRERQVLQLVARGHTNKEAALRLGVSVKTIETHRARLSEKLGLRGRAELYRFAAEAGLLGGANGGGDGGRPV
jgi:DNA-binding NarL/FixJ family response regulator